MYLVRVLNLPTMKVWLCVGWRIPARQSAVTLPVIETRRDNFKLPTTDGTGCAVTALTDGARFCSSEHRLPSAVNKCNSSQCFCPHGLWVHTSVHQNARGGEEVISGR